MPLGISNTPRKFQSNATSADAGLSETELLNSTCHHVILGDPGAGKSTAVKRLARHILLEEGSGKDQWQIPIVVRLREVDTDLPISAAISFCLGVRYEVKHHHPTETAE